MDFRTCVFEQTVKHAKTNAVKFLIVFPTLLCSIIFEHLPSIKTTADIPKERESPLSFHYKLFVKHHFPNIVGTFGTAPVVGLMPRKEVVAALKHTCIMLDERKTQFELMIQALEKEDGTAEGKHEGSEEAQDDVNEDEDEASESSSDVV